VITEIHIIVPVLALCRYPTSEVIYFVGNIFLSKISSYISPIRGPRCPEGSRKLRFPNFVTKAQDGGKVVSLTHRPLLPQEILLLLISVRG